MSEQKIDRTFNKALEEVAKLEKAFKPGGKLDKAIMDMGGDPTALREAAETFKTLNSGLTKAHFDALGQKEQLTEGVLDEEDEDGFMARSQLYFMAKDAIRLHSMIDDKDNLEPWVQSKIAQAAQAMDAVRRYTEYNAMKAQVEPEMEPAMEPNDQGVDESFSDQVKDFGMFSKGGNAQVQNAIQYILNDFDDATEKATNSERDMLRMQAHEKLMKELEDLSDNGYDEAMDTDVRERAAQYLETGIIRIMDRLDDLSEGKYKNDAQRKAVHAAKNESTIEEGTEFDAAGQTAEFKAVASDVVKNALAKAKSKVK